MNVLIFDTQLDGHHLEYIHHLYEGAIKRQSTNFYFAVPDSEWKSVNKKLEWSHASNISWIMLDDEECNRIAKSNKLSMYYKFSKLVEKTAKMVSANEVILINFTLSIPFLPILLNRNCKISGIIYKIFLRERSSLLKRILEHARYYLMSICGSIKRIWLLNDMYSVSMLNSKLHTNKFKFLNDPINQDFDINSEDLKKSLGINNDEKIFLHIGAMSERKGTLEILDALILMPHKFYSSRKFLFIGKISPEILDKFNEKVNCLIDRGCQLVVKNEFVDYNEFHGFCSISDCILIPYKITNLSSGILGYSSLHGIPVIGPNDGIIGDIIKDYSLGINLPSITPFSIMNTIITFDYSNISNKYSKLCSIDVFTDNILG